MLKGIDTGVELFKQRKTSSARESTTAEESRDEEVLHSRVAFFLQLTPFISPPAHFSLSYLW